MGQRSGLDSFDFYDIGVNTNNPLIAQKLVNMRKDENKTQLAQYLYHIALLGKDMLKGSDLQSFITHSLENLKS